MASEAERPRRKPCSGFEPEVADRIEAVMPAEGITPGDRECHDAQKDRLRVDFVYPDARPCSLALEVTAIVAPEDLAGTPASVALSERLSKTAEAEGLGSWMVTARLDRDFRRLEPEIAKVLRDAQPVRQRLLEADGYIRPGWYTSDDLVRLPRDRWDAYIAEHDRLKELGLEEVKPIESKREQAVYVLPFRSGLIGSFDDELRDRVGAKAGVLGEVGDLERHLGVLVHRWDVSNEPSSAAVPPMPSTIDVLWVVHRWEQGFDFRPVWVARRGDTAWRVYATG